MARKTATEYDHPPPPPKRPIPTSDRKRKRNPAKDVPVEDLPNRKRKQIPYQTSTQTLKVGGYPFHTKGNNEVIDTNTSNLRNKPGHAKKASKKILASESQTDDDFVSETLCGKGHSKEKKVSARGTEGSDIREDEPNKTEIGQKGCKGKPQPQGKNTKDGQKTRYKGFETRTTPNTLTEAVRTLTNQQKVAVGSMSLDGMLNLGITYVPTQFATWLLEAFDSKECKLVTPRGDAEILPKDVNFTLGLPMGGRPIKVSLRTIHDALLVETFRRQYGDIKDNKIKCTRVAKKIQESKEADDLFKLNFLVLFYSTMVESTKSGKANQRILNAIEGIDDIRALNWGEFMVERLRHTKDEWLKNKGSPYTGPLPLLMALYLDRFQDRLVKFERTFPAIIAINDDIIDKRIKSEIKQGGFGRHVTLLERNAPPGIAKMLEGVGGMVQEEQETEKDDDDKAKQKEKKTEKTAV